MGARLIRVNYIYDDSPSTLKVITTGDTGVGKTALVRAFVDGKHNVRDVTNSRGDMATSFGANAIRYLGWKRSIRTGEQRRILSIADTAGQEQYRSLTASYYRGAHGCLIVYDVTKLSSFENINYWLSDLKEYTSQPEISAILVGTKCHVRQEDREVTTERAQKFAESVGLPYMEVSAEESINVTEVFEKLADLIIENLTKHPTVINVIKPLTESLQPKPTKKKWCSC